MPQPPGANEQEREPGNTTPLSHAANISLFPDLRQPWEGSGTRFRWGRVAPLGGALLVVLALAVIIMTSPLGSGLLASFSHSGPSPSPPATPRAATGTVVGYIYFGNSGQYNADGSQGIADELQIDLRGIPAPDAGTSYYGWLLADRRAGPGKEALALGMLAVSGGAMHVRYTAADHTNLLRQIGSLLITQEPVGVQPTQPSADAATWRYRADFPQTPDPRDSAHHYSLLDQLRRLLADDPAMERLGLHGGLNFWFFRNVQKLLESASAAHDYWGQQKAESLLRSHLTLILDYLDGAGYAGEDTPAPRVAPFEAGVGLLEVRAGQNPPGYVYGIDQLLQRATASPGATPSQRALAGTITATLRSVIAWLNQVRSDARQLAAMSDAQLLQPPAASLLNDLYSMAQYAFVGQPDISGMSTLGGASLVNYDDLRLATLPVATLPLTGE
jgi:hypothetical protein